MFPSRMDAVAALAIASGGDILTAVASDEALEPDDDSRPTEEVAFLQIAVCGAHLNGMPLNYQLTDAGGWLLGATRTAANYRLFALPDGPPWRPALVRVPDEGASIEVEVWALPEPAVAGLVRGIAAPLGLGKVTLEGGREVNGFICEVNGLGGAEDITRFGGWRRYVASKQSG